MRKMRNKLDPARCLHPTDYRVGLIGGKWVCGLCGGVVVRSAVDPTAEYGND